jgi:hypothetical protein
LPAGEHAAGEGSYEKTAEGARPDVIRYGADEADLEDGFPPVTLTAIITVRGCAWSRVTVTPVGAHPLNVCSDADTLVNAATTMPSLLASVKVIPDVCCIAPPRNDPAFCFRRRANHDLRHMRPLDPRRLAA